MIPQKIPHNIDEVYPKNRKVIAGPPDGIPPEECGTIEMLNTHVEGGVFDGMNAFRTYYKPDEAELKALNEGGYVEFTTFMNQPIMQSVQVFGVEQDVEEPSPDPIPDKTWKQDDFGVSSHE